MRQTLRRALLTVGAMTMTCSAALADGLVHNPPQGIPGAVVLSAVILKGNSRILVEEIKFGSSALRIVEPDPLHFILSFDDKKLDDVLGGMGFTSVTSDKSHKYVLISETLGGESDPPDYKLLDISPSGVILSPDLGVSGDDPKVVPIADGVQVHMTHYSDQPDRTISFVNDHVQTAKKESFSMSRFEAGTCITSRGRTSRAYKHPQAEGAITNLPHDTMYVTEQVPNWTGLSDQTGSPTEMWVHTSDVMDVANEACSRVR